MRSAKELADKLSRIDCTHADAKEAAQALLTLEKEVEAMRAGFEALCDNDLSVLYDPTAGGFNIGNAIRIQEARAATDTAHLLKG